MSLAELFGSSVQFYRLVCFGKGKLPFAKCHAQAVVPLWRISSSLGLLGMVTVSLMTGRTENGLCRYVNDC